MKIESILKRKRFGLILRTFANKEEDVKRRVKMIQETIDRAMALSIDFNGVLVIRRIDVLVWADKRFSESDCGKTASALREAFIKQPIVHISEVKRGDLYCGILNYGIAKQMRDRIDYSLILSPDARSYMTKKTMISVLKAVSEGARAVGVAINELTESILHGRLANTFCLWDNIALMSVGGFDLRAAKPTDERFAKYMRGWSKEEGEVFYPLAGVEEIIPLARLVETFGPCLAAVLPEGKGIQKYEVPDPLKQPELYERHRRKMGTKIERQTAHLETLGVDITFLKGGIMPKYRL